MEKIQHRFNKSADNMFCSGFNLLSELLRVDSTALPWSFTCCFAPAVLGA